MALRGLGVRKNAQTAQFFLKHAAEQGGLIRSLMGTALAAWDNRRPQRALMHYLLAAHAGVEAAQHNAGFLYAHDDKSLHDVDVLREGDEEQRRTPRRDAQTTRGQMPLAHLIWLRSPTTTAAILHPSTDPPPPTPPLRRRAQAPCRRRRCSTSNRRRCRGR